MRRRHPLRLLAAAVLLLAAASTTARAQGLKDIFSHLFIFGPGEDPLFLAGSADPNNPVSIQAHGKHFIPSASGQNGALIGFLIEAIGRNVANVPIGATSGGETFHFEGGVPVKTSTSAGPIFGERAQTIGRGRALVGVGYSNFRFTTLRGQDLGNLNLIFTHQNSDFAGCDSAFGGDCSKMGIPTLENDIMLFRLALDMKVEVTSLYLTYGLFDHLDLSAVVPIVSVRMHGHSDAQIVPFGGTTAAHFFSGTPDNPVLEAQRDVGGSSFGLGDVALRAKWALRETPTAAFAILGDARFATGSEDDLLGSGAFSARGLAIMSARMGRFSPHVNVGYVYRADSLANDAVLGTAGFDNLLADRVTLAMDVVSELQVGRSKLRVPGPVHYDAPFQRTIYPTTIPDQRDDIVNGSLGFKFTPWTGTTLVTNVLLPLNRGGLRADAIYTLGAEYTF